MFNTGMYPSGDSKLDKYIQDFFIGMIEFEVLDYLKSCWNKGEPLDEYLGTIFPRAFISRNPYRAVEIIYDLDDIARSDVVRKRLPPLHLYAMYKIILNYEEVKHDIGKTKYDLKKEKFIRKKYNNEDADRFISLFEDPLENFIENYDDEFIWLDIWEHQFLWYINNSDYFPLLTPEAEEMLQLMTNDILDLWNHMKKRTEYIQCNNNDKYDFFISHATEDKNEIAIPLSIELERLGAKVWIDKFEMKIGDSLRASIDYGITHSKHGIIILSKTYMQKFWTVKEMNALFTKQSINVEGTQKILPIWHNVDEKVVAQYSPMLVDLFSINTSENTITDLAIKLIEA